MEEVTIGDLSTVETCALAIWGNFTGSQQNQKKIALRHHGGNV